MSYNSGASMLPVFMLLMCSSLLLINSADDAEDDQRYIDAASAPDAASAVERGMKPELVPYFDDAQRQYGITPGDSYGVSDDVARQMIWSMEVLHAMTSETPEQAVERGMYRSNMPYLGQCQAENGITPGVFQGVSYEQAFDTLDCLREERIADKGLIGYIPYIS